MASKHTKLQTLWYPSNYILALMDAPEKTAEAAAALWHEDGFQAEHILLLHGKEAVERIDVTCEDCGLLQQMLWFFLSQYQGAGRAYCHLLALHLPHSGQVERAHDILEAHGAYHIEYFEQKAMGAITELVP